jgi:TPP-dependent pyruvate/acetoin dehydrogenase alpha subunit
MSPSPTPTREQHLELYYFLRLNRELEEQMARLFRQNKILGGLYSSFGQEAISVGTAYALGPGDWIAPMIRNIGALLVRGYKPRDVLTQHMARYTSPTRGKDGTSHFGDLKVRHVISPTSVLGDLIPIMTGVAMAGRYLGQKIVTMTWIGDGGTSTGVFHEGLNLASVQKAPFVLIVENNQWAYSTPVQKQSGLKDLANRARAYGIRSEIVDGNDVVAVFRTAREAVEHARSGNGPVLIEAKTMRMLGHAQHDAAEYVPKAMREAWKQLDPLHRFEKLLNEKKLWDAKTKKEIDERIAREIRADVEFAENSPAPPPETAAEGVYCEGCHTTEPDWQRPKEELLPPRSSVKAEWPLQSFSANGAKPSAAKHGAPKAKAGKKPARAVARAKVGR